MNKQTRLLASLGLLVGLAVAPAFGQVWSVKVKVPFKFVVTNKTLPEGEYMLSSVHDEVFVQDSQGKRVAMVLTNAVGGRTVGKMGEVVFECYTDLCFLSQLWTPGQDNGRELLRSHLETEIAKRETGKYFALLAPDSSYHATTPGWSAALTLRDCGRVARHLDTVLIEIAYTRRLATDPRRGACHLPAATFWTNLWP